MTRPPTRRELPFDPDPLEVDPEPVRRHYADRREEEASLVVMAVVGLPILLLAIIAVAAIAASRPGPTPAPAASRSAETTAPVDLSGMLSARLSGAPHAHLRLPVGPSRPGGAPSSPAVANVATSEGLSGPTTPMPATHA